MTTAPLTAHATAAHVEAQTRQAMAERAALKLVPGSHGEQAAMVAEVDALLDEWAECGGR